MADSETEEDITATATQLPTAIADLSRTLSE